MNEYLIVHQAKPLLLEADWNRTVMMASSHSSFKYVCSPQLIDHWFNLWDYIWGQEEQISSTTVSNCFSASL